MEWKYENDDINGYGYSAYALYTDRGWYDVVYRQYSKTGWYIAYNPHKSIGGYISNKLYMHCITSIIDSLPDDCFFKMPEEAKAVCERHYELLVLQ